MNKGEYGVHAAHCCATHGCKYNDLDCPVVAGLIEGIVCEKCGEPILMYVEPVAVYAKLNYARDRAFRIIDEPWGVVKDEYISEAKEASDMVFTEVEIDEIIKRLR